MSRASIAFMIVSTIIGACTPLATYTPPEESGLVGVRPYPYAGDVCMVIGESAASVDYLDHTGLLIGCPNHERGAIKDRQTEGATIVGVVDRWTLLSYAEPQPKSEAEATYQGHTVVYFDPSHGTQVEYYSAQNRSYLWYPGNTRIVTGDWKIEVDANQQNRICHRYQTNSYNPVTGVRGGNWECANLAIQQSSIQTRIVGDPFGLASGAVPYVFERQKLIPLDHLAQGAGVEYSDLTVLGPL